MLTPLIVAAAAATADLLLPRLLLQLALLPLISADCFLYKCHNKSNKNSIKYNLQLV